MTLPGLAAVTSYQRAWLPKDVIAGLVLASLLVPQGMAYAELAGLPAITGLYTSMLCLLAYAVFGPSRVLVLGPDSSLGPMIAATILPLQAAGGDPVRAVALASVLAILVGAFLMLGAVARLGFIADLLSKPIQIGYMNGLALTILVGQLPKLFGFSTDANGLIGEAIAFGQGVRDGETVAAALGIGLVEPDPAHRPPAAPAEGARRPRRRRLRDGRRVRARPGGPGGQARRRAAERPAAPDDP